jgi:hypothetical protein
MMNKMRSILGGSLVALALACSTTSTPTPTLTINSVSAPATVATLSPPTGRYFVELNVTLANVTPAPVSAWFYYYSLITESGLAVAPSIDANAAVATPCSFDITLGPAVMGLSPKYTCNLVFEVPCAETAAELIYGTQGANALVQNPPGPSPSCSASALPDAGTDGG